MKRLEGMRRGPGRRPFSAEPFERAGERERPSEADDHAH